MARAPRHMPAGLAYHVLNRANGRSPIFAGDGNARRFVLALAQAVQRQPEVGLLAWCLMPNHWHLVLQPSADDVVQRCLHWLTVTHTQRHRAAHGSSGDGHLYQGRYRSFPVATDGHLLTVLRYVERNPVRAGLVTSCADWPWSSACRHYPRRAAYPPLTAWPIGRPDDWTVHVDRPLTAAEEAAQEAVRRASQRGTPFGPADWARRTGERLGLARTMRPRGRPPREKDS